MYILLAISILCFFALVLAIAAITQHVRTCEVPAESQPDFAQHLFAAAKDQDSFTQRVREQQSVKDFVPTTPSNSALQPTLANIRNQSISSKRL
jgi:hypothetical protein